MRRVLAYAVVVLALSGTLVVLPVYSPPGPTLRPVSTSTDQVEMGSLDAPAPRAEVQEGATEPVAGVPETAPALRISRTDVDEFSLVGVTWAHDPAVSDTVVNVRVRDEDGSWGSWTELTADDVEQDVESAEDFAVRGGTAPLWTGPATGIEAELVTRSGARPTDVQLDLVDPGSSPADSAPGAPAITDTAHAASAMPPVYSRAQWGADESIRGWDPEYAPTIKAATVHHTADSNGYTADDVPAIMRSIYRYHAVSRGWGDIGYHVVVDRFGRAWEGRYGGLASTVVGAHAGGFNTGTFGVSMLGTYSTTRPSDATVRAVATVIAWKFSLYGVNPNGSAQLTSGGGGTARFSAGTKVTVPTVFGHRDVGSTSCPGDAGYAQMPRIRSLVAELLPTFSNPAGSLDAVTVGEEQISLAGWAFDPDEPQAPASVHVYVDNAWTAALTADQDRADVAAVYPEAGAAHGYAATLAVPPGLHGVCVYAINTGNGTVNPQLGCRLVNVPRIVHEPRGAVDAFSTLGRRVTFAGWALDVDAPTTAVDLHAYVDGRFAGVFPATSARDDVAAAYSGAGPAHGFGGSVEVPGGTHTLCLYAINIGAGSGNPALGCTTTTVASATAADPVGSLDAVTVQGGTLAVAGWAIDPDAPLDPVQVHLYVDGRFARAFAAQEHRGDVAAAYLAAGSAHAFWQTQPREEGRHRVCAYAINLGAGGHNPALGCREVTVAPGAWNPVGAVDGVLFSERSVTAVGWTADMDTPQAPIPVHVYVDGRFAAATTASGDRADVAAVIPAIGPGHGFAVTVPVPAGSHEVCVYAINQGLGSLNPQLGCRTVVADAAAYEPVGALDGVTRAGTGLSLGGWALDPDVPAEAVDVHVYVDGAMVAAWPADQDTRPDVDAAYPGAGSRHGFGGSVTVSDRGHQVCVYALNRGSGSANPQLGCRTVP